MSTQIFRYEVPVDDETHTFQLHGDPLAVDCRSPRVVEFWALHDDGLSGEPRHFRVVGTGQPLARAVRYHGTALSPPLEPFMQHGALVWHLIEVPS